MTTSHPVHAHPVDAPDTSPAQKPAGDSPDVVSFLRDLWQQLLRVPHVNPDDNFFTLGGDSVLVIEMLVAVAAHFDREFEYHKFFSHPTLGTLTGVVVETLRAHHD